MKLSIILPIFNEKENIEKLYKEIKKVVSNIGGYEIICVNDASTDGSSEVLKLLAIQDKNVKIINFVHNFGQTAAMSAGIKSASGDIIVPMDADLQNDSADIPAFLKKIDEGYDVVSGWRKNRQDKVMSRKIPSKIANYIIRKITGVSIHDYGCSMKAYKKELIQGVNLYGEMHRFIPAYAAWHGAKVTEIVVNHRPRIHGKTKYGISRTFKVILDLIVVKFLSKYMNRPVHFFGGLGFVALFIGVVAGLVSIFFKIFSYRDFVETPLPIFSALFIIVGVQLVAMGIIAEMLTRVYYESQNKMPYTVRDTINF